MRRPVKITATRMPLRKAARLAAPAPAAAPERPALLPLAAGGHVSARVRDGLVLRLVAKSRHPRAVAAKLPPHAHGAR